MNGNLICIFMSDLNVCFLNFINLPYKYFLV